MAKSFESTRSLTGGESYTKMLRFVPDADKEIPKEGHDISESEICRFLLNEETMGKFDEAKVEIPEMLGVLKDIDKQSKITQVEIYQSSMRKMTDLLGAFHVFIVFKTTCETEGVYYWWSLEKNTDYIVLQRCRNQENVKDKLEGEDRTRVKLIKEDLKGKCTIKDLFAILWARQMIQENYHILYSNCQFLVTFVGQQITEIGYKYKGKLSKFLYSPPPERGWEKGMLELINDITGSDWSFLFHLIFMGSTDLVDKIVRSGIKYDINASCNGLTPLHLAIMLKKTKMVQHLLQPPMNADPTKRDASGKSALQLAVSMFEMKAQIIDLLLEHDVNVDDVNEDGQTALHLAAWASNVSVFQKLLKKGANPNIVDKKGVSPLHVAVQESGNPIVDLLLAHPKVKVDNADENGQQTALHWAVSKSNVIAFQKLLENGANPNITDKWGQSLLHMAAIRERNGNEIMDLLLAHSKVKVDDVDGKGRTALHIAAYESNAMAVNYLINKGANLNAVDKSGDSPLLLAARQRNGIPIIDLLLKAKQVKGLGDINDQNKQGRTALHYAAAYSNEITAEHLINKGANVNCRANVGLTPLDMAALGAKDMKIIDLLLQNINEGDIQQYRNDERLFLFARHNLHGLEVEIIDRLCKKGIIPQCTETDDCITAESDNEATASVNTRRLVDKGADPSIDLTGFDGLDFLITRIKKKLEIDEILKKKELDINGRNEDGETPLLVAILGNNMNAVRLLLERGADPSIRDENGYTPFQVASVFNYRPTDFDILNLLLSNEKVDINETTSGDGWTALHLAIMKSDVNATRFLLLKGANPNVTNIYGYTPLHFAAWYAKDMDIVELLLNHPDINVNCLSNLGRSALDKAKKWNEHGLGERISNLLKEKGAVERENKLPKRNNNSFKKLVNDISINAEIKSVLSDATVPFEEKIARINEKNLISAIRDSDVERVRRLLKNGADISSARREDGMNALHLASRDAETDVIDAILETGKFDINGVDSNGRTPLHCAIRATDCDVNARHLIQQGADSTIANNEGHTALHLAASHENIETINLILENEQVDINSRGKKGRTALHHAIRYSKVITVRYLLKKGADPNAADKNGSTPLHLAAENYYAYDTTELIEILLETGKCNINGVDNDGRTPLHDAIKRPNLVAIIVRRLIKMGADRGIADKNGVTPLHMAARNAESMDLIELLLNTEAVDVNCVDIESRTPLDYARDNKHGLGQMIINRLKEYGAKE